MAVEFNWHIPVAGDGRWSWTRFAERTPRLSYLVQIARAAEFLGFDRVLVPCGFNNSNYSIEAPVLDAYTAGVTMLAATQRLQVLIAHRPGFINPGVFAQMTATADDLGNGRLALNIVTAGAPGDMEQYGDRLEHDARYRRAEEFVTALQQLWTQPVTNYKGEFYELIDARVYPKPIRPGGPPIFLAGASEAALQVAARQADVYMMSAEPPERIAQRIQDIRMRAKECGRSPRFCVAGTVITAATDEEARAHAREYADHADLAVVAERRAMGRATTSAEDLRARAGTNMHTWTSPTLWSGVSHLSYGSVWVGGYDTLADLFLEYVDVGVEIFQMYGHPFLEQVYNVGENLVPRVKRKLADRAPANNTTPALSGSR